MPLYVQLTRRKILKNRPAGIFNQGARPLARVGFDGANVFLKASPPPSNDTDSIHLSLAPELFRFKSDLFYEKPQELL